VHYRFVEVAFAEEPERALEHTTEALALARGRPHVGDLAMALVGHATALIDLERLDEAEALLDEAATLIPQLGASDVDVDGFFDELAAARGDWAHAARLFLRTRSDLSEVKLKSQPPSRGSEP
jgi:hypothetical protein